MNSTMTFEKTRLAYQRTIVNVILYQDKALEDLTLGGSNPFIFMQFSAKNCKFWDLAPPPEENRGSAIARGVHSETNQWLPHIL